MADVLIQVWHGTHQRLGVRVRRTVEKGHDICLLDESPGIHHGNPVAHPSHDPQVMGDEDNGCARGFLDLLQQIQVLKLDRGVQRGGGLVGYEHVR